MQRRLLVIGLDAVETALLRQLAGAGRAPNLAALEARSRTRHVEASCMSLLPGAIWQDILTGRSVGDHGDYYVDRVHTGETTVRQIDPEQHVGSYYIDLAAAAGRRVIAIDLPLVPAYKGHDNLTLVAEWHLHDAVWGRGTHPAGLLAELEGIFGRRPYERCDTNHTDADSSLLAFAEMLKTELTVKTDMAVHLMQTREWDHALIGLSQGHCAGHQTWHMHDASEPPSGPVVEVYAAIDAAVGRLIDAAGPDTDVVVFTSHGMGPYIGGPQLLPKLLQAWGYGDPRPHLSVIRRAVPRSIIDRVFRAAPRLSSTIRRRGMLSARMSATTKGIVVPNNRVGAIRLNVAGRDPEGAVTDVDAELSVLEARLLALRAHPTGEPIVERTVRTSDAYGADHHRDLPDLLVAFRRDLGPLTSVDCPEAGRVDAAIRRPYYPRTGDHTDASFIWVDHHDVTDLAPMRSTDIAATVLAMLEVDQPPGLDGRVAIVRRAPCDSPANPAESA